MLLFCLDEPETEPDLDLCLEDDKDCPFLDEELLPVPEVRTVASAQ